METGLENKKKLVGKKDTGQGLKKKRRDKRVVVYIYKNQK